MAEDYVNRQCYILNSRQYTKHATLSSEPFQTYQGELSVLLESILNRENCNFCVSEGLGAH